MATMKKLPDAEFAVMKAVWELVPPVTSGMLVEVLNREEQKIRKLQTVHTLLGRLVERGFLKSEKAGKERLFIPLIMRDEYIQYETQSFMKSYHDGSRLNLVSTLYSDGQLNEKDIEELTEWLNKQRKE